MGALSVRFSYSVWILRFFFGFGAFRACLCVCPGKRIRRVHASTRDFPRNWTGLDESSVVTSCCECERVLFEISFWKGLDSDLCRADRYCMPIDLRCESQLHHDSHVITIPRDFPSSFDSLSERSCSSVPGRCLFSRALSLWAGLTLTSLLKYG